MGIPVYFYKIASQYGPKVFMASHQHIRAHMLYIDCNSIIYSAWEQVKSTLSPQSSSATIEEQIAQTTIQKIHDLMKEVVADNVYIALDGVAPAQKIIHQPGRRLKTVLQESMDPVAWSTVHITPGTPFMTLLETRMHAHFKSKHVQVSDTHVPGEGEQKIFEHIRANPRPEPVIVYGTDADLVMLSLYHLRYGPIYLYRMAPTDIKKYMESMKHTMVDIPQLSIELKNDIRPQGDMNRFIADYVFISFLLSNDFIAKYPVLDLRHQGYEDLIQLYGNVYSSTNYIVSETGDIQWKQFHKLVHRIAEFEYEKFTKLCISREHYRQKMQHGILDDKSSVEHAPSIHNPGETHISPRTKGWKTRYYSVLFQHTHKEAIYNRYIQRLEWNWYYYTRGCPNWRHAFYDLYAPLFKDLDKYLAFKRCNVSHYGGHCTYNPYPLEVQLSYVTPSKYRPQLFSSDMNRFLQDVLNDSNVRFKYEFCRYFWECGITNHLPLHKYYQYYTQFHASSR